MMELTATMGKMAKNEIHHKICYVYDAGYVASIGEDQFEGYKAQKTFEDASQIAEWFETIVFHLHNVRLTEGYHYEPGVEQALKDSF